MSKTKEMVIDFRTKKRTPDSLVLKGSDVERVSVYKYLGIVMDVKLAGTHTLIFWSNVLTLECTVSGNLIILM